MKLSNWIVTAAAVILVAGVGQIAYGAKGQSKARVAPALQAQTLEIKRPASLLGHDIESPILPEAGVKIRLLDRAAMWAAAPIVVCRGEGLYLRTQCPTAIVVVDDVLDGNGTSAFAKDGFRWSLPDDDGEVQSYPLTRPLDDTMTLRLKIFSAIEWRQTGVGHLKSHMGTTVNDALLRDTGLSLEVLDPTAVPYKNRPFTRGSFENKSTVCFRLKGPAQLLSLIQEPEMELEDGLPWGVIDEKQIESDTSRIYIFHLSKALDAEATIRLTIPVPASAGIASGKVLAAGAPVTQPSKPPTHARMKKEIPDLVAALGNPDAKARASAIKRLVEIGSIAVPALKEAAQSDDPGVRASAGQLARGLDRPALPPGVTKGKNNRTVCSLFFGTGDADPFDAPSVTMALEGNRRIMILEDELGIRVAVRGRLDGREVVRHLAVKDPAEAEHDAPQYFALQGFPHPEPMDIAAERKKWVKEPTMMLDLQVTLKKDMKKANVPETKQAEVLKQLKQVGRTDAAQRWTEPQDAEKILEWYRQSDKLRKMAADLKLPELDDDALAQRPSQRLAIGYQVPAVRKFGAADPGNGLWVTMVVHDQRGAGLGLQVGDFIQKMNGHETNTDADYRGIMKQEPARLVIEGIRDGKPIKLNEP